MYTESEFTEVKRRLRARGWRVGGPAAGRLAAAIATDFYFHGLRNESGWVWTGLLTVLSGAFFLFFYGVTIRPVLLYKRHVERMLHGRLRETTGILREIDEEPKAKDGLDCISLLGNVGDKADPEDDRLFYFDMQKGKPDVPLGTRVLVRSNDRMVSSIQPVD